MSLGQGESDPFDAPLGEIPDQLAQCRDVGATAERERAAKRWHRARTDSDDQLVVVERGAGARPRGGALGLDRHEAVDVARRSLVSEDGREVEVGRLARTERLRYRHRPVEEGFAGCEDVELDARASPGAQSEQDLERGDARAGDEDAASRASPLARPPFALGSLWHGNTGAPAATARA